MSWIKRNLFMAVSGAVVLVLLGLGGFYLYSNWSKNASVEEDLEKNLALMTNLYNTVPFPHPTNVTVARNYLKLVKDKRATLQPFFSPVPAERVTGIQFLSTLDKTLAELHRLAAQASVELPRPDYGFSFDGVRKKASFDPGSFPLMPQQLADIKAISTILFEARIRPLVNIRRARVSIDDSQSTSDYFDAAIETNLVTGTVLSPYEFEFQCMSENLATAIDKLARSPHGFIVRIVRTEPADERGEGRPGQPPDAGPAPVAPGVPPSIQDRRNLLRNLGAPRAAVRPSSAVRATIPGRPVAAALAPGGDVLVTPLKEKRIRVVLNIVSIRPEERAERPGR